MESSVGDNSVKLKIFAMLLVMLFAAVGSELAAAYGHGEGHGGGHVGGYRSGYSGGYRGGYSGARIGINLGFPFYGSGYYAPAPYYYSPSPYYYPPAQPYYYPQVAPQASNPYIEQGSYQTPPPAQQTQGASYFCAGANAYYPDVRECPEGWQLVSPQPR
jgi:hypothetical protein